MKLLLSLSKLSRVSNVQRRMTLPTISHWLLTNVLFHVSSSLLDYFFVLQFVVNILHCLKPLFGWYYTTYVFPSGFSVSYDVHVNISNYGISSWSVYNCVISSWCMLFPVGYDILANPAGHKAIVNSTHHEEIYTVHTLPISTSLF